MFKLLRTLPLVISFAVSGCKAKNNQNNMNENKKPIFHITGEKGWINDPNGVVKFQGKYHVFYQHHPYSNEWGPMHWGHVVSEDLLNWSYLPFALTPGDEFDKDGCFSGTYTKQDLYFMLQNEIYAGVYLRRIGADPRHRVTSPETIRVPGGVPAILSPDEWNRACSIRLQNASFYLVIID